MNLYQTQTFESISSELNSLEPISLSQMDSVSLMNRIDVKYIIPIAELPEIVREVKSDFQILEVANKRISTYKTLYFDSPELKLYHDHHTGRAERYKVRLRNYVSSNTSFFEIKEKDNKGRTLKIRIKEDGEFGSNLSESQGQFLESKTPLNAKNLNGDLWVIYDRFTLVSLADKVRITIDLNLSFNHENSFKKYGNLAIIEIKQNKLTNNKIESILRKKGMRPMSLSKYCLGRIVTTEGLKYNRFKSKLLKINTLQNGAATQINS